VLVVSRNEPVEEFGTRRVLKSLVEDVDVNVKGGGRSTRR
jgi:hypothetical protein